MRTLLLYLILATTVGTPSLGISQTIDTFRIFTDPANPHYPEAKVMQVGPGGDMWLILPNPQRLVRISGDDMQCVFDSGIMTSSAPALTISPDGTLWIGFFEYIYSPEDGLRASDVEIPPSYANATSTFSIWGPPMIDADCRMYLHGNSTLWGKQSRAYILEVAPGSSPVRLFEEYRLDWPFLVSATEFWADVSTYKGDSGQLCEIDLSTGSIKFEYQSGGTIEARDSEGIFWCAGWRGIYTFNRHSYSEYCSSGDDIRFRWPMVLSADWTIWVAAFDEEWEPKGVIRIQGDEQQLFSTDDGLLTNYCGWPKIDCDGRVWFFNEDDEGIIGLSRISDGGWPPMRLMLREVATEGTIAVEAQVINNGPVVGVDVYVALEQDGQLLYWPNWQPAPNPVQVNLRPGHNQTATIISAPRESIPSGAYKFWGCMTGRNTQKLIGPLDRKFEALTVEVD